MAINDGLNKVTDNIVDRTIGNSIERVAERRVNALFGGKIDDNGEYDSIADIRIATREIPEDLKHYQEVQAAYGYYIEPNVLNNKGIQDRSIKFYTKYLSGNNVETMFNSISDKVVSASARYVKKFTSGETEETSPNIDGLKDIDKTLAVYGRAGVYVTQYGERIEDFEYTIIEPYRYSIDETTQRVYSRQGTHKVRNTDYPKFAIVEAKLEDDGQWKLRHSYVYVKLNRKYEHELVEIELIEEVYTDMPPLYEIRNTRGGSELDEIKESVLVVDMIETLRAVEAKQAQFSIHADQIYFEEGRVIKQDVYRMIESGFVGNDRPMYEAFQPNMRVEEYINYKNDVIEGISRTLGVSTRALGISQASHTRQVATIALLDEEKTAETINNRKHSLQRQFNDILGMFYKDVELVLPEYVSQSMAFKAEILSGLEKTMSVEAKVKFLHPAWDEEEQIEETIKVKIEQNITLTKPERETAEELGLIDKTADNTSDNGTPGPVDTKKE